MLGVKSSSLAPKRLAASPVGSEPADLRSSTRVVLLEKKPSGESTISANCLSVPSGWYCIPHILWPLCSYTIAWTSECWLLAVSSAPDGSSTTLSRWMHRQKKLIEAGVWLRPYGKLLHHATVYYHWDRANDDNAGNVFNCSSKEIKASNSVNVKHGKQDVDVFQLTLGVQPSAICLNNTKRQAEKHGQWIPVLDDGNCAQDARY
jgi:hypothetical protein